MQDFDYCKSEFEWFLSVQYKNISNLKDKINEFCHNFCFDDLYDDNKINELFGNDTESRKRYHKLSYGSNSKDIKDGDDTTLARIIFFLIHIDYNNNEFAIPGLISFSDLGSGYKYKYRGDTINTYSTLFGSENKGKDKFFTDKNERAEIDKFRRKYQTIGNFFILPATTIETSNDKCWNCFTQRYDYVRCVGNRL